MFALETYTEAIFWDSRALAITPNDKSGGFVLIDCYGFIPAIWLCVCYVSYTHLDVYKRQLLKHCAPHRQSRPSPAGLLSIFLLPQKNPEP